MVQSKTCTKCGECKPLDGYYKDKRARDGLYSACKECSRTSSAVWKTANRERVLAKGRAYYSANYGQRVAASRKWKSANRERDRENNRAWRDANTERARENSRAWAAANPDRIRAAAHRRRAKKACAVPQRWTVDSSLSDPLACWWCGRGLLGADSHVDHVLPIALGGPADQANEVPACSGCNTRKGAKHPLVWIAELATADLLGSN